MFLTVTETRDKPWGASNTLSIVGRWDWSSRIKSWPTTPTSLRRFGCGRLESDDNEFDEEDDNEKAEFSQMESPESEPIEEREDDARRRLLEAYDMCGGLQKSKPATLYAAPGEALTGLELEESAFVG